MDTAENNSISCDGCGACCEFMLIRVSGIIPADWALLRGVIRLPNYLAFHYPCKAYDPITHKCIVHGDNKPEMCKQYEVGCRDCRICRRIKGITP